VSSVGEVNQAGNIAAAAYVTATASCPAGSLRLGGGAAAWSSRTDGDLRVVLVDSYPSGTSGWAATAQASGSINQPTSSNKILRVTAYVVCTP
jgi:hypothetical protein